MVDGVVVDGVVVDGVVVDGVVVDGVVVDGVVVDGVVVDGVVDVPPSRAELRAVNRGYLPCPQKAPLKSSRSSAHTIQPPYPCVLSQFT